MGGEKKPDAVSLGGSEIYRHGPESDWEPPAEGDSLEEVPAHIEKHLGKIESVFHEIVSDAVHIDVHIVRPTESFPFIRLVTTGMSDRRMTVPADADATPFAELMVTLPHDWKLDTPSMQDENWYWPVRLLKTLARLPHKHQTWLGWGHTIPHGDPAEPYAPGTKLMGAIILPSITVPDGFNMLQTAIGKRIAFYAVVPLYEEEMNLKLRSGTNKLLDKLSARNLTDIIDPTRENVARKRFGLF